MTPFDSLYPPGPAQVPADLTKATPKYRRQAWLATGVLLLFAAAYLGLTGWFLATTYRLTMVALTTERSGGAILVAACSAFIAVFLLKALFFVQHRGEITNPEITADTQPRVFRFLHRLADEAGAPRPHRVFVSPPVNAAVFYDLSIVNLLFPSRKNLEIGLGLVNALTLDEFKAVCAHEFGHFAQRSMAVGRWVYTTQQIAAAIIAKRDALDTFLAWLGRLDIRIAWIGWILSLIVWSIRSLLESVFTLVLLAHRALSREMEFQADLVAVSLTGSDALIHALHKLQAADDAWDRTLGFASQQAAQQQKVRDLFGAQTRFLERMRDLLGDPDRGRRPAMPASNLSAHRIFSAELAQPPRMWSTHPPNNEREENAKRTYLPAPADDRPAWEIFDNAHALREQISTGMITLEGEITVQEPEETLRRIDEQFDAEPLKPGYRGVYLGRSAVASAAAASDLYAPDMAQMSLADLDSLYPPTLTAQVEQLRGLEREKAMLEALQSGALTAPDGVIRHRGKQIQPAELPASIQSVEASLEALRDELAAQDRRCRTVHRTIARRLGQGWETYLASVASLLHYADHTEVNLDDAYATLQHVIAVEAATGRVTKGGVNKIVVEAKDVHRTLADVHAQADFAGFDPALAKVFQHESMREALGSYQLPAPETDNVGDWLGVANYWVRSTAAALGALKSAALRRLLTVEAELAEHFRRGTLPEPAPPPCRVPPAYRTMTPGTLRPKKAKLSWWARFQTATGIMPAVARTATALAIVGAVLFTGAATDQSTIYVYNGLERDVRVAVNGRQANVAPRARAVLHVPPAGSYAISARTRQGALIESFKADADIGERRHFYSVAGAVPLVSYTVTYGITPQDPPAPTILGAPRWATTAADHLFEPPPRTVSLKRKRSVTRVVIVAAGPAPSAIFTALEQEDERKRISLAHARWDQQQSPRVLDWMRQAMALAPAELPDVLRQRLRESPDDGVALRFQQDLADRAEDRAVLRGTNSPRESTSQ